MTGTAAASQPAREWQQLVRCVLLRPDADPATVVCMVFSEHAAA